MKREPLELEPLDEARWARIEEGIFDRLGEAADAVVQHPPLPRQGASQWLRRAAPVCGCIVLSCAAIFVTFVRSAEERSGRTAARAVDPVAERARVPYEPGEAELNTESIGEAWAPVRAESFDAGPRGLSQPPRSLAWSAPTFATSAPMEQMAPAPVPGQPSRHDAYEQAARLEASDPDGALARYRSLADGTDSWAAIALYADGRLALDRGDTDRAVRSLQEYVSRFTDGPNALDAENLLTKLATPAPAPAPAPR